MARERKLRRNGRSGQEPVGLWDRPPLLNLLADLLLVLGAAGLAWGAVLFAMRLPVFPVRQVLVLTPLARTTPEQVAYVARQAIRGTFFTLSLDDVRAAFEKLPWVRRAEVRRHWPDGLEVVLEERIAAARWKTGRAGEVRLVSERGEVFAAAGGEDLPVLAGPEGSAALMLERHAQFEQVVAPLGLAVSELNLSPRLAWQLRLADGLAIELGRDQAKAPLVDRLARFVAVRAATEQKLGQQLAAVDLRYPNGFAVRGLQGRQ